MTKRAATATDRIVRALRQELQRAKAVVESSARARRVVDACTKAIAAFEQVDAVIVVTPSGKASRGQLVRCEGCGQEFKPKPKTAGRFCSRLCSNKRHPTTEQATAAATQKRRGADQSSPAAAAAKSESAARRDELLDYLRKMNTPIDGVPAGADGGMIRSELARRLGKRLGDERFRQDVANTLTELKQKGLVTRDGSWWTITARGLDAAKAAA